MNTYCYKPSPNNILVSVFLYEYYIMHFNFMNKFYKGRRNKLNTESNTVNV